MEQSYMETGSVKFYFKIIRQNTGLFTILFILNFFCTVIGLSNSYLMATFIDALAVIKTVKFIYIFVAIYLVIQIVYVAFTLVLQYMTMKANLKLTNKIAEKTIRYLHRVSILNTNNYDSVYLAERINSDSSSLSNFLVSAIQNLGMQIVIVLTLFIVLAAIDMMYVVLLFGVCFAYILLYLLFRKNMYRKMINYKEAASDYLHSVNEQILFIDFIQTNCLFESFIGRLKSGFNLLYKNGLSLQKTSNAYAVFQNLLNLFMYCIILIVGGMSLVSQKITVGQFTIIFTYTGIAIRNINALLMFGQTFQNAKASYDRIKDLYKLEPIKKGEIKCECIKMIRLENVNFYFENNSGVENVTYCFEKGVNYLLMGENGSGKTTLIHLLLLQYPHYTGKIEINGINIREYDIDYIRQKYFSVMSQKLIFPICTIKEYFNLVNKTIHSEKQIIGELNKKGFKRLTCDILDLINRNVQDINLLSGGEKQKIELARMALKDADVLLFDEPTAHLDFELRREFYDYLCVTRSQKITIIISHNTEERKYFDYVIEMNRYSANKENTEIDS